jgi:hypothetical protein
LTGDDGSFDGKKFVTAVGNGLRLTFHSDGSDHRWTGFRARFVRFNGCKFIFKGDPTKNERKTRVLSLVTHVMRAMLHNLLFARER